MISLTGSFVIDTTCGTDEECTITIQDHPFKNNDEERYPDFKLYKMI